MSVIGSKNQKNFTKPGFQYPALIPDSEAIERILIYLINFLLED
ncbi:MAG TPA: hypothetical protein PLK58_11900 [Candidatus Rifleibacterium sp.]|nr:hypothetical protein [Candidatus Rifleibacterium sp.]HPW59339.1 hypothetical protein [Candidatus Rifleibacterium sp.]